MRSTSFLCGFSSILSYAYCFDIVAYLNDYGYYEHARRLSATPSFLSTIQDRTDITILVQDDASWNISDNYTEYSEADKLAYCVVDMRIDTLAGLNIVNHSLYANTLLTYTAYPMKPQIINIYQYLWPNPDPQNTSYVIGTVVQGGLFFADLIGTSISGLLPFNGTMPAFYTMESLSNYQPLLPPAEVSTTLEFVGGPSLSRDYLWPCSSDAFSFNNSIFLSALNRTNILPTLSTLSDFTIFAPSDEAFAVVASGPGGIDSMDISAMTDLLLGHIVPNQKWVNEDHNASYLPLLTANGGALYFTSLLHNSSDSSFGYWAFFNNAKLCGGHYFLPNGVLYLIDEVLFVSRAIASAALPTLTPSIEFVAIPSASSGVVSLTISATTTPVLVTNTFPAGISTTGANIIFTTASTTPSESMSSTITSSTTTMGGTFSGGNSNTATIASTSSTAGAAVFPHASVVGAAMAGVLGLGAALAIVV